MLRIEKCSHMIFSFLVGFYEALSSRQPSPSSSEKLRSCIVEVISSALILHSVYFYFIASVDSIFKRQKKRKKRVLVLQLQRDTSSLPYLFVNYLIISGLRPWSYKYPPAFPSCRIQCPCLGWQQGLCAGTTGTAYAETPDSGTGLSSRRTRLALLML